MAIICTVRTSRGIDEVKRVEEANQDIMQAIGQAAVRNMVRHRRIVADGEVIDIDEYVDRAAYDAMLADAGEAIAKYQKLLGSRDTIWEIEQEFDFAQMRQRGAP